MTASAPENPGWLDRLAAPPTGEDDPKWQLIIGLAVLAAGYALIRHRAAIGDMTGYCLRGMYVSNRTPGWLLLPFGVVIMLGGAFIVVVSVVRFVIE